MIALVEVHTWSSYLRLCMEVDGFTAKVLAEALGVSAVAVCHWRAGRTVPDRHEDIAAALPSYMAQVAEQLPREAPMTLLRVQP